MKEKTIKFLNFLFPCGNYRYYVMYLSSLLILSIFMVLLPIMMSIMVGGFWVSTDTFVAHQTSSFIPRSDFAMEIVNKLLNLSGYILLVFVIHTGLSIIADFIIRPILWSIKVLKSFFCSQIK